ncbi:MAG: GAF domain-containing protein [Bacteroidia bacterium]|nr:GAF domain-containing protein [Bacteroidia bacterium]MCO5255052.1 GAF domain-containing protein [Bacteroidota bacterium]MCZ2129810.1 GAF domain-containing protein [Bacteroidia bacterium]
MLHMKKAEKYELAMKEIVAVWDKDIHLTGNLANITAILKTHFDFWWVGFYQIINNKLQLSAFQGPVACTQIAKGKGVCGTAWEQEQTIVVPNVHEFSGHIACNSESNSEIVIPVMCYNSVWGVLDIDSKELNHFDETDAVYLEKIVSFVSNNITLIIPY